MAPTSPDRRAALGQPRSATQGMIDYWRDQYRDYSKDLDALWNRLRPGFAQLPPAAPPSTIPSAREAARSVDQIDGDMTALHHAINAGDMDYMVESARRKADRAAGWPGSTESRKRQLEAVYAESQARLYAAFMERRLALMAKVEAELLEKERAVRALTWKVRDGTLTATEYRLISPEDRAWVASSWRPEWKARLAAEIRAAGSGPVSAETAEWAERAAAALVPRPARPPAPAQQPPVWFEELRILARNYTGAMAEAGRLRLDTPARARADAEVARAGNEFKDHFDSRTGRMSEKERGDLFWQFLRWNYGSTGVPHMVAIFLYPRSTPAAAAPTAPAPRPTAAAPVTAPPRPAPALVLPGPLSWEAMPALSPAPSPFIAPFAARRLPIWAT